MPRIAAAALLLAAAVAGAGQVQTAPTQLETRLRNFRVDTSEEFLGHVGQKTVVRFRVSSLEIARALAGKGVHQYSMTLRGSVLGPSGQSVDAFSYPISGAISADTPVSFSFLRALVPGDYEVELDLGTAATTYGKARFPVSVPEVGDPFRPERAPADASTLPSAEAVVLAAPEAPEAGSAAVPAAEATPRVRILPPARETALGLMRVDAVALPPVTKIEFYLDDRLVLSRTRPPYTVEIDLGKIPHRQTIRAAGYDAAGNLVDEDAYVVNAGSARVAVHILPMPERASGGRVPLRVAVQSINGGTAKRLDVYLDSKKIASFAHPPYEVLVPAADYAKAQFARATAYTDDGTEADDLRYLHGATTISEAVRVDVVQLHVSALDSSGKFVGGLAQKDFQVFEDGAPQKISSFEVAENLPLRVGLVIDGSGSMRPSMDFVHRAGMALFQDMIRPQDSGFVIQFRETPTLICAPTSDVRKLVDAVLATDATGQTALYDSVVLGLYQFRATEGRKALIVITDGGDNHSWVDYPTMLRYARQNAIPIYVIGVHVGFPEFDVRAKLKELAGDTGGQLFLTSKARKIPEIVQGIEAELRSQYVMSYRTGSTKPDGEFRTVKVSVDRPGVKLRTIRGYVP